jgi:hypothetical protein
VANQYLVGNPNNPIVIPEAHIIPQPPLSQRVSQGCLRVLGSCGRALETAGDTTAQVTAAVLSAITRPLAWVGAHPITKPLTLFDREPELVAFPVANGYPNPIIINHYYGNDNICLNNWFMYSLGRDAGRREAINYNYNSGDGNDRSKFATFVIFVVATIVAVIVGILVAIPVSRLAIFSLALPLAARNLIDVNYTLFVHRNEHSLSSALRVNWLFCKAHCTQWLSDVKRGVTPFDYAFQRNPVYEHLLGALRRGNPGVPAFMPSLFERVRDLVDYQVIRDEEQQPQLA